MAGQNQADIVFVIDKSGSMEPCIQGVKDNINTFIKTLETEAVPGQLPGVDWTLGLVAFDNEEFQILDPTKDMGRFQQALASIQTGRDEIPLAALDWALDFPWRSALVHRVIIFMTDEPFTGGDELKLQLSWFDTEDENDKRYLINKFRALEPILLMFAPASTEFRKLAQLPNAQYNELGADGFSSMDFSHVMNNIGKSIAHTMGTIAADAPEPAGPGLPTLPRDIYGMAGKIRITKL